MCENLSELGALELKNLAEQGCFVGKEVKRRVKEIDNMPRITISDKEVCFEDGAKSKITTNQLEKI